MKTQAMVHVIAPPKQTIQKPRCITYLQYWLDTEY